LRDELVHAWRAAEDEGLAAYCAWRESRVLPSPPSAAPLTIVPIRPQDLLAYSTAVDSGGY